MGSGGALKVADMQAFAIEQFGLENLKSRERQDPKPGPGELLLEVNAVSLNYRDLLVIEGHYNPKQQLPLVPCSDAAATVIEVGAGVTAFEPGRRVCPLFCQSWEAGEPDRERLRDTLGSPIDGTLRQRMVVAQSAVVAIPDYLSQVEAATLPCAALTAWSAMVVQAQLTAGDWVLILGTGGVSIFALQFAQILGLRTIVTSSSNEKLKRARELGADHVINYVEEPKWGKAARKLTGRGVDLVVEVGGAGTLKQSLEAVRIGGQVSLIGVLSGVAEPLNVLPVLMKNLRIQGILVGHRDGFLQMLRAMETALLKPVVDRVFPFAESPRAFQHLQEARHFGKVCIELS